MVAVAMRMFGERGYASVSMEEIAAEAGVSKPMLYAYFDSKEGLFAACGRAAAEDLARGMREAADVSAPPDERLWLGLLGYFDFAHRHRRVWATFSQPGPIAEQSAEISRGLAGLLGELMAASAVEAGLSEQAASQVEPLARALTAAAMATVGWWLEHPDEPKELHALRLMNLVWTGLAGMMRGELWLPPDARPVQGG
jgi:AcrR family transcriptional regulator